MIEMAEPNCVRMKREIQARLAEDFKDMTDEEIRREQARRIEENPIFGPLSNQWKVVNPGDRSGD